MKKLTTFYHAFWKSISSFSYYHDIVKAPFFFSFKYFWVFSFVFGLILTGILSAVTIPPVTSFISRFESRAPNLYPADLVVTIKDGILSTNGPEPLKFPIPMELFVETPGAITDQQQQYLVTIDTKAQVEDYAESKSMILINQKSIIVPTDDSYRVYPLADFKDMIIDKTAVNEFLQKVFPLLRFLPFIVIIGLFCILTIVLPLARLLSLVFLSLILVVAGKLLHLSLSYTKMYQIGLHTLTLPTLLQVIMISLHLESPIPFFNSILFILYTLIVLAELKKPKQASQITSGT